MTFWIGLFVVFGVLVGLFITVQDSFFEKEEESSIGRYENLSEVEIRKREEILEYVSENLNCKSNFSFVRDGANFGVVKKEYLPSLDTGVVHGEGNIYFISSRVPGQTVEFHLLEGEIGKPVLVFVPGINEGIEVFEERLEAFNFLGYTIISLKLILDGRWLEKVDFYLQYTDSDLLSIQTAKVLSILDFIDREYPLSSIILHGRGWGSVLVRNAGVLDSRVDLVISEEVIGDPQRYFGDNIKLLAEDEEWSSVYLGSSDFCSSGTLEAFSRLDNVSHIIVIDLESPSAYITLPLIDLIKSRYDKIEDKVSEIIVLSSLDTLVEDINGVLKRREVTISLDAIDE